MLVESTRPHSHRTRTRNASKWDLLSSMGVFTLHTSNVKGFAFEFAWACVPRPVWMRPQLCKTDEWKDLFLVSRWIHWFQAAWLRNKFPNLQRILLRKTNYFEPSWGAVILILKNCRRFERKQLQATNLRSVRSWDWRELCDWITKRTTFVYGWRLRCFPEEVCPCCTTCKSHSR